MKKIYIIYSVLVINILNVIKIVVVHDEENEVVDWQTSQPILSIMHENNREVEWDTFNRLEEGTDSEEHIVSLLQYQCLH